MAQLNLTDLPVNTDLDLAARREIRGGMFSMTSIVAIFETMQFTQNAATFTIINDGTAGSVLNNISNSSLSAASPMQYLQMTAPPAADVL